MLSPCNVSLSVSVFTSSHFQWPLQKFLRREVSGSLLDGVQNFESPTDLPWQSEKETFVKDWDAMEMIGNWHISSSIYEYIGRYWV